jgi:CubicO group peptidase (beta-lactamase class C family)
MQRLGHCDQRFEAARTAFKSNFSERGDVGASVYVTLEGKPVVDLWGGDAAPGGAAWAEDTIVNVYSTTKTMASPAPEPCEPIRQIRSSRA